MEQQPLQYVYDDEIDLREYLDTLLRWWREILSLTLLCAIIAGAVSSLLPPIYEATASVALIKERSTLDLGSTLTTITDEELTLSTGRAERRNAMAQLVSNPLVAEQVIADLGEAWFTEGERDPSQLVRKVDGEAVERADLIAIRVSDGDPQRAAALATAWGRAYVDFINRFYSPTGGNYEAIVAQLAASERSYDTAQTGLQTFTRDNQIDELSRAIAERKATLDRLQADKKAVLTTLFDPTWEGDLMAARLDFLLAERAFGAEMVEVRDGQSSAEGRALLAALANPPPDAATLRAWLGQPGVFSTAINERLKQLALNYALLQRYRSQLTDVQGLLAQLNAGGDPATSSLAILLLKTEILDAGRALPGNLQLQLGELTAQTTEAQLADLAALETMLMTRIDDLERAIADEYTSLSNDMSYGFMTVNVDDPADFVNVTVARLQGEIQSLQAELEAQQARRRELISERDLAWESYQTLARREAELRVDREVPDSEVRFTAPATVPLSPTGPRRAMNTAIAAAVGGMLAVVLAFLLDYMGQKPFFGSRSADSQP